MREESGIQLKVGGCKMKTTLFFYISRDGHGNGIDMMDKANVMWNRMGENVKRKKEDSW